MPRTIILYTKQQVIEAFLKGIVLGEVTCIVISLVVKALFR